MGHSWRPVFIAFLTTLPGIVLEVLLRAGAVHPPHPLEAIVFGVAIVGAAFLLSWAAEVLQLDVSQGIALALLALIAILPEYVVDATFAWKAAREPEYAGFAVANMTGANRLLIGLFWPLVVAIVWFRTRKRVVTLERVNGLELVALLAATVYAFIIPIKGSLSLIDLVVLVAIFVIYVVQLAKLPAEEPHLVGPARTIGALPTRRRRQVVAALGLAAAAVIFFVAEPFAESLVASGTAIGIDEFLLVQWLAPLASEAPEAVIVCIFAWRGAATTALGALVSSKINQWTLLVAMLPLIFAISSGGFNALPLDGRQEDEIFLTAAQSLFAVALLLDLRLGLFGAGALFGLFVLQLAVPDIRTELGMVYIVLAVITVVISRRDVLHTLGAVRAGPGAGAGAGD